MHNDSNDDLVMAPSRDERRETRDESGESRGENTSRLSSLASRLSFLAAGLVCTFGVAAAIYFLRPVDVTGQSAKTPPIFAGWPKPELAIVISGQQHGYWQRCGCSDPQLGGLTRRYNFIQSLKANGWPVVAVDVGEIAQSHGPQALLKYDYSMRALRLMDYFAAGLGKTEFNMPLAKALGAFALNNNKPAVIATNLIDPGQGFELMGVHQSKITDNAIKPQLGFFSVVDDKVAAQVNDPAVRFAPAAQSLYDAMKKKRASVNIVIYHGSENDVGNFLATFKALRKKNPNEKIPDPAIVLSLTADPEPPARTKTIENTTVVSVGWKGRYVGVLGMFPEKVGYSTKYELVSMGEQYETPNQPDVIAKHPVMNLWEEYSKEVEKKNFLPEFPRGLHLIQNELNKMGLSIKYVGSDACKDCHQAAHAIWQKSHHGQAFAALEHKAKYPSRRQFDGECVQCHTVGFHHIGGYMDKANPPQLNAKLTNVGCESCHGPGGAHVANPQNLEVRALINPYSTTQRIPPSRANNPQLLQAWVQDQFQKQDDHCQKCHDQENDVHWGNRKYPQTWALIQHYNNQKAAPPGNFNIAPAPPNGGNK